MNNQSTIPEPTRLDDPDLRNAEKALHRAAAKAQARAVEKGYKPVVFENGRIIEGPITDVDAP